MSAPTLKNPLQRGRAHVSAERTRSRSRRPLLFVLQRGRAHVSAERSAAAGGSATVKLLQRGRAHVSAERQQAKSDKASYKVTSTGPRSRERGERRWRCGRWRFCIHFNGAALT